MQTHYSRCQHYLKNGLGLERSSVSLCAPSTYWSQAFEQESTLLMNELQLANLQFHHCGSTSVGGLYSKPIIDILGILPTIEPLDQKQKTLENLGYEYKGEYGIKDRRFCVLYNEEKTISLFHLHIFPKKSKEIQKHLIFRDYLRVFPSAKKEYEEYKFNLIKKNTPRECYSEEKSPLIQKLLTDAYEYFKL